RVERRSRRRHPFAAGQIVHQHQRDAGKRQAEPEQITAQPGAVKRGRVDDGADHATDNAEPAERSGGRSEPMRRAPHCSTLRLSGGTSATVALALICKALIYAAMAQRTAGSTRSA